MTQEQIHEAVMDALLGVAPDIEASAVDPAQPFRDQFDFDSMDFINFILALHRRFGLDIPETDYGKLNGIDAAVSYLRAQMGGSMRS